MAATPSASDGIERPRIRGMPITLEEQLDIEKHDRAKAEAEVDRLRLLLEGLVGAMRHELSPDIADRVPMARCPCGEWFARLDRHRRVYCSQSCRTRTANRLRSGRGAPNAD